MPETEKRRSDYKGLKAVLVRLEPRQDEVIRREALRRATRRGDARPDKSEIVREALDAWIEQHGKRGER